MAIRVTDNLEHMIIENGKGDVGLTVYNHKTDKKCVLAINTIKEQPIGKVKDGNILVNMDDAPIWITFNKVESVDAWIDLLNDIKGHLIKKEVEE